MCDPVSVAVTAAVTSAGASIIGGIQQNKLAKKQGAALDEQGQQENLASFERANRIRNQGQRFLASQRLAILDGGIEGGSGSALEVGAADAAEIELDALTEIYGGQTRSRALRDEAKFTRKAGKNAQTVGIIGGVGTLLTSASTWDKLGGGTSGHSSRGVGGRARASMSRG